MQTELTPVLDTHLALADAFLLEHLPATREAYKRDLTDFFRVVPNPLGATRADVDAYARQLAEVRQLSQATIAKRLSAVSGFYRRALDEGLIARNPVAGVRRPKVSKDSQSVGLDVEEARALLAVADEHSPLASALIALLLFNGLRVSEATQADWEDLSMTRGHVVLTVRRKGGARVAVPLTDEVSVRLEIYRDGRLFGPLFGADFDRLRAYRLVTKLATIAVPEKAGQISPHSLRHTFVTLSLDAGVPLHEVQDAASHSSPVLTQRYNRARHNLDHHATYALADFIDGKTP